MPTHVLSNDKLIDRVLIWRSAKANPGLSIPELSVLLGKPEWTVRRVMKLQEITPKELLQSLETEAVTAWREALPIAGKKGDHRPAKDLLLHTRAIQPVADQQHAGTVIMIGQLLMPGVSRAERDSIDQNVNDLQVIDVGVAAALPASAAGGSPEPTVEEGTRRPGPATE